ncbi:MAG: recombination regulator RecX [Atopobiaceae bacterium]|jgi:regulatory protein|nr:recombination regulator RecX [Atopobiaceae bacterium]MCH4275562.1 recombination regulator RecX [Atopobiaceae bacterium]MCI1226355.1 recombination regulator RecX [Atopobiaceae bacterium]MCI1260437.1 recombination regulator RecX [Atopobiaceae bacterium]
MDHHTEQSASQGFAWNVELPSQTSSSLGGRRPRAKVLIGPSQSPEVMLVPLAVGKALTKASDACCDPPGYSSRAELLYAVRSIEGRCAVSRLSGLVDRRDYSVHEARTKLHDDGYLPSVIDEVIDRAKKGRVLDDDRFADVFIRTKVQAGWGSYRIERELARKGIEASAVPGWPDDYLDPDGEVDRAYDLIASRSLSGAHPYEKLVRFLSARGFSLSVSKDAARRVLEDRGLWRS